MFGEALLPPFLLFTLLATVGLAPVPLAHSATTSVAAARPILRSYSEQSVRAEGYTANGEPIDDNTVLTAGESIIATAFDFDPGTQVTIRLSGANQQSRTALADASGTVRFAYKLSPALSPGRYRVIVEETGVHTPTPVVALGGNLTTTVPRFALLAVTLG